MVFASAEGCHAPERQLRFSSIGLEVAALASNYKPSLFVTGEGVARSKPHLRAPLMTERLLAKISYRVIIVASR